MNETITCCPPFWSSADFWIFLLLSLLSLGASILAFVEAKAAKVAAHKAGETVKIQTITIELSEITQKLDVLEPEINYSEARNFYTETNRRIRRLTGPFRGNEEYRQNIEDIFATLDELNNALSDVRPIGVQDDMVGNPVYFAVEKHFSRLNGQLAELMGNFENRNIKR